MSYVHCCHSDMSRRRRTFVFTATLPLLLEPPGPQRPGFFPLRAQLSFPSQVYFASGSLLHGFIRIWTQGLHSWKHICKLSVCARCKALQERLVNKLHSMRRVLDKVAVLGFVVFCNLEGPLAAPCLCRRAQKLWNSSSAKSTCFYLEAICCASAAASHCHVMPAPLPMQTDSFRTASARL